MTSEGCAPATRVIRVIKIVVALRVGAECGIVNIGGEHERSAAAPASDQLRSEQFLFCFGASMRAEEPIERTDARLVFAKADISAVATEYVRLWHRQRKP